MSTDLKVASRRQFLNQIAAATGASVLMPALVACGKPIETTITSQNSMASGTALPLYRPSSWNPIEFNRQRGLAGAVPTAHQPSLQTATSAVDFIGKHIAYVAPIPKAMVPAGSIALMIGDNFKGYAKHGATAAHWYDWISISKEGSKDSLVSTFASWPTGGNYMVLGTGTIDANAGLDTIYIAALPADLKAGDTIRVVAHCNLHGEFVDFITL